MSVYWTLVCDERREAVSPYALDGQGAKGIELTAPWSRFGALALYCMMNRWLGARVRLAQDFDGDYRDVSFEVVADFNHYHGSDPAYPPIVADRSFLADDDADERVEEAGETASREECAP